MAQTTSEKLGIKPESTVLVLGADVPADLDGLGMGGEQPAGVRFVANADGPQPLVVLVAGTVSDVISHASAAFERTAVSGRFWIAYRKGANRKAVPGEEPPLHRDTLQAGLAELGLDGVTLIALNETWSAMRVKAVA